jgi:hypothetical protein
VSDQATHARARLPPASAVARTGDERISSNAADRPVLLCTHAIKTQIITHTQHVPDVINRATHCLAARARRRVDVGDGAHRTHQEQFRRVQRKCLAKLCASRMTSSYTPRNHTTQRPPHHYLNVSEFGVRGLDRAQLRVLLHQHHVTTMSSTIHPRITHLVHTSLKLYKRQIPRLQAQREAEVAQVLALCSCACVRGFTCTYKHTQHGSARAHTVHVHTHNTLAHAAHLQEPRPVYARIVIAEVDLKLRCYELHALFDTVCARRARERVRGACTRSRAQHNRLRAQHDARDECVLRLAEHQIDAHRIVVAQQRLAARTCARE